MSERGADHRVRASQIGAVGSGWPCLVPLAMLAPALGATIACPPSSLLVWNASPSSPMGLYAVLPASGLRRDDMVVAWPPPRARALAAARGYAPAGVPLVKRIAALAGDRICSQARALSVNGHQVALRRDADGMGRPMPTWRGCGTLRGDRVLLLANAPDSFDGRYFGPVGTANIVGKAKLLWRR